MLYEGTEKEEETEEGSSTMDNIQLGLDGLGLIPVFGEFADGLNGIISLGRGDFTGAGLSFISMIPGIGDAIGKGGKLGRAAMKSPVIKKAIAVGAKKAPGVAKKSKKAAEQIKATGKKMAKVKNVVTKKAGDVKKLHKSVLNGDLKALEKQLGKEIPDKYRTAAEQALKMAGEKMKDVDMKDVMDKIDTIAAAGEEVDETSTIEESLKYDLFYQTTSRNDANKIWNDLAETLQEQTQMAQIT